VSRRVLVVDRRADSYVSALREAFPQLHVSGADTFEDATAQLAETEILLSIGTSAAGSLLTAEVIAQMGRLEWIQCLISGTEHVLDALGPRRGVLVTSTTGIHGPQVSEMALLHMLMLARDARGLLRNQDATVWERLEQHVLHGKAVGIVGLGAIGRHLACLCSAFDMTVYGASRSGRPVQGVERVFGPGELTALAPLVDFLVLVLPGNADTERIIDAEVLSAMKPTAYLVNLARGAVLDEQALIDALRERRIAGAGLDVFAREPLPPDSPLWTLENELITPHLAGYSDRYAERALTVVLPNMRHYLAGEKDTLINVVRKP
jgi:D-2-hydroxyacid dehydrogenase (NADP+)